MVVAADAVRREVVGEPVDAFLGVGVGEAAVAADQRFAFGDDVGDGFPQVGEVVLHRRRTYPRDQKKPDQKKSVPPSTAMVAPTTKLQTSEQRKSTTGATSSGSPTRPMSFDAP